MFKKIKRILASNLVLILLITIPLALVCIWFREGNIMATGESGLPFYNPSIQYESVKNAWNSQTLGYASNIGVAAIPSYFLLNQLTNMGISPFLPQAIFFWFVLFSGGLGIYLFTKELFPYIPRCILILSVFFYWFNPFSLVNIWNRFLNNFLFFYAFLPIALYIYIKGLKTTRFIYSVWLILISLIFSYAFSSVTFSLLFWLLLAYTTIFYLVFNKGKERIFAIQFFILSFLFWCIVNFWWINQVLSYIGIGSFTQVVSTSFSTDINYSTFSILSGKLGYIIDLFRLKHNSFFADTEQVTWVSLYAFPIVTIFEFIVSGIILFPILFKRRQKEVIFIGSLFILSIFFSKGNSAPLGEIFDKFFKSFTILQLFRNPLEKIGFLLPLSAAPLFCLGTFFLIEKFTSKTKVILFALTFWLLIVWGGPFWTGLVFTSREEPTNNWSIRYEVKIPEAYKEAEKWLKSQGNNFRLIIFPLGGEGITYTWAKGYSGVELSNQLLSLPSISFNTNIPFYDELSKDLEKSLLTDNDFTKIANNLNVRFILIRSDINWKARGMRDPQIIYNKLIEEQLKGNFKQVATFGELTFFENLKWTDKTIYSVNTALNVLPYPKISDSQFVNNKTILIGTSLSDKEIPIEELIHPTVKFSLEFKDIPIFETRQDFFPHVRFLPSSRIYELLLLKEDLGMALIKDSFKKIEYSLSLLGKRLVEAAKETDRGESTGVLTALSRYNQQFEKLDSDILEKGYVKQKANKQAYRQEEIYLAFSGHKALLSDLINKFSTNQKITEELKYTIDLINSKLENGNIKPIYDFQATEEFPINKRVTYKFDVLVSADYELLWGKDSLNKYYKESSKSILLQIDDEIIRKEVSIKEDGFRTFGKIHLEKGIHEISTNTPEQLNLVSIPGDINLRVEHDETRETYPIRDYDPYGTYLISAEYLIKSGIGAALIVEGNNSPIKFGKPLPLFSKNLPPDYYEFGRKKTNVMFKLNTGVDTADLILRVKPWNNCTSIYSNAKDKCEDESFRRPYDKTTEVIFNKAAVYRSFTDEPLLLKSNSQIVKRPAPQIEFKKISNVNYHVSVSNASEPFLLILSELFDPGWKLLTYEGEELGKEHILVNSYANGWLIAKSGTYQMNLTYAPQEQLNRGKLISVAGFSLGIGAVLLSLKRKKNEKS